MLDAARDARGIDVDDEADAAVQGDRERLRAAHAAAAAGQRQRARQRPAEALLRDGGERLVGALDDPLGADVDPRAGRHLAVHRQPEVLEPAELGPVRPVADQVGVGDEHARRPLVRLHDADRPAGLDEHRLVLLERRQGAHHGVEGRPVARGLARAAVDDQVVGPLGDLGVEVVHQHPQRRLGGPRLRGQLGAARSADGSCTFHVSSLLVQHFQMCPYAAESAPRAARRRLRAGDRLGGLSRAVQEPR